MRQQLAPSLLGVVLAVLAASCGGGGASPTAPSNTPTVTTPPPPATLSLTGTWMLGQTPQFTITQNGSSITGTQIFAPIISPGIIITMSGTVTGTLQGTTEGSSLSLSMPTTIITVGTGALAGTSITCTTTSTWAGQATNTTMTGTYTSGTYKCDGAGGYIDPRVSGTQIYTKQ